MPMTRFGYAYLALVLIAFVYDLINRTQWITVMFGLVVISTFFLPWLMPETWMEKPGKKRRK